MRYSEARLTYYDEYDEVTSDSQAEKRLAHLQGAKKSSRGV